MGTMLARKQRPEPLLLGVLVLFVTVGASILVPVWWGLPWGAEEWASLVAQIVALVKGS